MAKFKFGIVLNLEDSQTARLGDGASGVNQLSKLDNGKFLKLIGDSQYGLCAVGNEIEAVCSVADDIAPQDGFTLGAVLNAPRTRLQVMFDGLQATPGTGTIAVGDYVVAGTVTARGTALTAAPKVCKATAAATGVVFKWRVVALDGTGAVGQTGLIERV